MPASPLKSKHAQVATNPNQNGRPMNSAATGLQSSNPPSIPGNVTAQYEEAQADEIEALKAIYMEDFIESQTKGAWHKAGERTFKLTLRASSDESVFVTLNCALPVTYPKSLPSLSIDKHKVKDKVFHSIQSILNTRPKQMVGQVMIHELATDIQDILEDAGDARALDSQLPSLEEERAQTEAAALAAARQKEAEDLRHQEKTRQEEELTMQRMVEDEFRRRQDARRKSRPESSQDIADFEISTAADLTFDHAVNATDPSIGTFRALSIVSFRGQGPLTKVLLAKPVNPTKETGSLLVLKRLVVPHCRAKKAILDLEDMLEDLKSLRSANILSVLDFRVEHKANDVWQFDILTEHAARGSLRELLEITETLSTSKARSFGVELLQSLDFLHKNGICHSRVHLGNVMLCSSSTSGMTLKLGDSGFQECLYRISLSVDVVPYNLKRDGKQWIAPELAAPEATKSRKTDVWDAACVIVQMIFGVSITEKYQSASAFMNSMALSEPLDDLLKDAFRTDPKRRPTAFDLVPYEFFRTDAPAILDAIPASPATPLRSGPSGSYFTSVSAVQRSRWDNNTTQPTSKSRYEQEWDELGRLGKGGYGEVVKSRNKLDGRVYAIKKITQKTPSELSQVLSEVYLLATLNHPYVVRYFTAWPEEEASITDADDSSVFTSTISTDGTAPRSLNLGKLQTSFHMGSSAGGLDFISSSGYPKIEFGADTDEEDEDAEEGDDDDSDSEDESAVRTDSGSPQAMKGKAFNAIRRRSESRVITKSTLFIQMEFCERQTLRDMIRRGMNEHPEEVWRLLRQILEGLVHIHSHGMIHRDLKPENIFIDNADNPKIGDFGLATTGQYFIVDKTRATLSGGDDMTKDVGTTLYVAPELSSNTSGHYTDKVDIYSLGIMLFEMCFPLPTAMERMHVLTALRKKDHTLPEAFKASDKQIQGELILSLVQHKAAERPSSAELLRSGKIPIQIENDTIRTALEALSDSNSPYFHKMMAAVFSRTSDQQMQEQMWDMGSAARHSASIEYALLSDMVRDKLLECFRRHGAVQTYRQGIFPRSAYNTSSNVVQLLDASGALVQLPFDMTLPHARTVAKQPLMPEKTFTFGTVFRDEAAGSAPRSIKEADFDIISKNAKDLALTEAEVMKVVDEILSEFPCFTTTSMCFHISHSGLLDIILGFCRIALAQRSITKEILGRLNIGPWNWSKIRLELRAPSIGIPSTSLDDLAQFDFRDTPEKAFSKLQSILQGTEYMGKITSVFTHVAGLNEYLKRLGVRRKIYFSPLSNFNEKFYKDSIMFQCLFDGKKRDVLAAGGRYDHLIEAHQSRIPGAVSTARPKTYGVGVNIAWERIVTSMARYQKSIGAATSFLKKTESAETQPQTWNLRRCDVLIASFDPAVLRSTGVKLCSELWANDVSAELAIDVHSTEELQTHYRDDKHSWWITIRHDVYGSGKADLRVKSRETGNDVDVRSADILSFLRGELRERAHREGTEGRLKLGRHHSHAEGSSSDKANHQNNVIVLVKTHKSKKVNKWQVVEAAQTRAHEVAQSYAEGPVVSVETRDDILEKIRETRLSDTDSWRRVIQDAPSAERKYLQDLMELLITQKEERGTECRKAFIYNFRTGMCVDYDLLL